MKVEKTAYLKIRFDWLYSIYVIFAVAVIVRYLWLAVRHLLAARQGASDHGKPAAVMNLASPFALTVLAIIAAQPARPADRPRDDLRGSILYLLLTRSGHGHRPPSSC